MRLERRGPVALLTIDRPDALNALNGETLRELLGRFSELAGDASLRALVVTGAGRAFVAGADIAEMQGFGVEEAHAFSRQGHRAFDALEALPVPTLAAVGGFALGGGCELACACDWIYASEKARFGQPEVGLGTLPGFGGTSRLVRRVGIGWAKELVLGGAPIDAETALRIGLVNRLFPHEELLERTLEAANLVAGKGPLAVAAAKRVMQEGQDADLRVANALEQGAFARSFATRDREEGMEAFLEKREPKFEGR